MKINKLNFWTGGTYLFFYKKKGYNITFFISNIIEILKFMDY